MIRWITPHLGTSPWSINDINKEYSIVDVRSLRDEGGNSKKNINKKVNEALMLLNSGITVIICCDHGMSRSNAIASAVLAKSENINFFEAVIRVIQKTGEQQIKVDLLADVETAIFNYHSNLDIKNVAVVLGKEGFISRNLIACLEKSTSVLTFDNEEELIKNSALLWSAIRDKRNFDLYFLWNPEAWNTNKGMADAILRLRNVLEVIRLVEARLIWFSGSQIFYGWSSGESLLATEEVLPNPANAVGDGFFLCETLINLYRKRHNCKILVIRPSNIYGLGDNRRTFFNSFINKALNNQLIETHSYINGLPLVNMLHISDFIDGVIASSKKRLTGTLHLSSEEWISTSDLAHLIIDASSSKSALECIEIDAIYSNICLLSNRAKLEFEWHPKIKLKNGIEQLLQSIKYSHKKMEKI